MLIYTTNSNKQKEKVIYCSKGSEFKYFDFYPFMKKIPFFSK